ncbi:MAG TPA: undecaprenyldiphospho-muramoylpentapeptide beta-N-acetylglucosaminyltransferase [Thermoanaerobaculia bacterium]|jgi:UDP-N-acetylglucosamine--N-acetylmuramyl-(pentapeptide) pyrophosphoryl-undecaprenol N-acetylglucosamine transferase|nr:undecaprenyldiphospho-muramoylpentapeptide beta-N-acetylglucosaminyltransferase [Thermoanaerobaculia bacterium]
MARPTPLHVLLAGGGTGGHVFPALAVGDELRAQGWRVSFTGMQGGLEERLVGERGIPFFPLPARPLVGRGLAAKIGALTTLARSAGSAKRLIREIGAHVVLGTGGYVSAPAVVGARLARRPVLLLEPNGRAGVANRWLSRMATAADVGYRETAADLHCPCRLTGVPIRSAFFAVPSDLPAGPPRLLVLGGSQGAQQINQALPAAAKLLLARLPELSILHQTGARNLEETKALYIKEGLGERVEVVPFLDDVAGAMAASHLLVSRAGAITIAEICAAGRPSVLVPLAIAKAHQMDNARLVVDAGGAEVIPSDRFSADWLAERVAELLSDLPRLAAMGRAARSLARPRAAADIADHLAEIAELGGAR